MVEKRSQRKFVMQSAKPTILCTGPIEESAFSMPECKDAIIEVIPFTKIIYELSELAELELKELLKKKAVVVFTSNNAIKSITGYLNNSQPDWKIFCIGNTTYTLAKKYFGEDRIMQTASTAAELAEKIVANVQEREVIFFCGNLRRNDLPDAGPAKRNYSSGNHSLSNDVHSNCPGKKNMMLCYFSVRVPQKVFLAGIACL
jgi:uroporphyrinogen-III synthase